MHLISVDIGRNHFLSSGYVNPSEAARSVARDESKYSPFHLSYFFDSVFDR